VRLLAVCLPFELGTEGEMAHSTSDVAVHIELMVDESLLTLECLLATVA
jgi:hypothetical protein